MKILDVHGDSILLDDEDWLRLCGTKWKIRSACCSLSKKYVCCNKFVVIKGKKTRRTIYLHRAVMKPPYGLDLKTEEEVHHKNGDT